MNSEATTAMTPEPTPPRRSPRPMPRRLASLLLAALLLANAALGQEPKPVDPSAREEPRARDAGAEAPDSDKPAAKASRPSEVFKPSEEISEDLSVPFPVDI